MQYMRVRYGEPFRIPRRLGDLFKDVVRIDGVDYVRGQGFVVRDYYALVNLNKILLRLGLILTPIVTCAICYTTIDCEKCEFTQVCRKDVNICICGKCASSPDSSEKYRERMENLFLRGSR